LFCLYGAGRNDFDAGNKHYKGHWKRWARENREFLGPEMATSEASSILAQKCGNFQGQPFSLALVMDLPPSRGGVELY